MVVLYAKLIAMCKEQEVDELEVLLQSDKFGVRDLCLSTVY